MLQIILDLFTMKILVTGGAGFIGSHTVVELAKSGFTPIVADNFSNSNPSVLDKIATILGEQVIFYQIDCKEAQGLNQIFVEHPDISGVIHFAAFKAVGESVENPEKYYHNNLTSLTSVCRSMSEHGVYNLVFSSSCTVYGNPDIIPVTEESAIKLPLNPYGHTKQLCESVITGICESNPKFSSILLRYFNPIGAHPSGQIGELPIGVPNNLMPYITQTAAGWREAMTIYGNDYQTNDGTCVRDFIHVVDLAKAHVKALQWINPNGNIASFNIGTGGGCSVLELVTTFIRETGVNLQYKFGPRRTGDIAAIFGDVTKANELLGWKAELTIADAVKDAWRWQQTLPQPT